MGLIWDDLSESSWPISLKEICHTFINKYTGQIMFIVRSDYALTLILKRRETNLNNRTAGLKLHAFRPFFDLKILPA